LASAKFAQDCQPLRCALTLTISHLWFSRSEQPFYKSRVLVELLGLVLGDKIKVRYADGRGAERREAEGVYVELLGRHGTFTAVVEPRRKTALIGAIVREDLDLLVDCQKQRLVPRDARGPIFEIE
jgi:hypothetical protein